MNEPASSHDEHSYEDHHEHMILDFRRRLWVSLALSVPILALSPMIQELLGFELEPPGSRGILFALSALFFGCGGWPLAP